MVILEDYYSGERLDLETLKDMYFPWERTELAHSQFQNNLLKVSRYRHRVLYFGTENGTYPLDFEMITNNMDLEHLDSIINKLNRFIFDIEGKPKLLKVYMKYNKLDSDKEKFRVVRMSKPMSISYGMDFHKIKLYFDSERPWKFDRWMQSHTTTLTGAGGSIQMVQKGIASPMSIFLKGQATGLTITSNGVTFDVGDVDTGTGQWHISTEFYLVSKNEQPTMMKVPSDLMLIPDQPIIFSGTNLNLEVNIQFRDRFL